MCSRPSARSRTARPALRCGRVGPDGCTDVVGRFGSELSGAARAPAEDLAFAAQRARVALAHGDLASSERWPPNRSAGKRVAHLARRDAAIARVAEAELSAAVVAPALDRAAAARAHSRTRARARPATARRTLGRDWSGSRRRSRPRDRRRCRRRADRARCRRRTAVPCREQASMAADEIEVLRDGHLAVDVAAPALDLVVVERAGVVSARRGPASDGAAPARSSARRCCLPQHLTPSSSSAQVCAAPALICVGWRSAGTVVCPSLLLAPALDAVVVERAGVVRARR